MKKMCLVIIAFILILTGKTSANAKKLIDEKNLEYKLDTVEGGYETTSATDKPKVLIFYMQSCYWCNKLFEDIGNDPQKYVDYDILAIDIKEKSPEIIINHKKQFGELPVRFCVDGTSSIGFEYKYKLEGELIIGTPYMVYIDENDHITGYSSGYTENFYKTIQNYLKDEGLDEKSSINKDIVKDEDNTGFYRIETDKPFHRTVEFARPVSKKIKKATVPNTVLIGENLYKVDKISKNAFKGCKNLKQVTIGRNVKEIGDDAFKGCKKLKKIKIQSTMLDKVAFNAFKDIPKTATYKYANKKVKKYINEIKKAYEKIR